MTTIRQLIQTSPTKANELLAKLTDTSDNAVKTRERLFTELKAEMELLASLEEEHLFPVLRKHKATKESRRGRPGGQQASAKAAFRTRTDSKGKYGVFQQHVRDKRRNSCRPC